MITFDTATMGEQFETAYSRLLQSIPVHHPFIVSTIFDEAY